MLNQPEPPNEVPDTAYGTARTLAVVPVGAAGLLVAFYVMHAHHPLLAAFCALAVLFGAFLLVGWAER